MAVFVGFRTMALVVPAVTVDCPTRILDVVDLRDPKLSRGVVTEAGTIAVVDLTLLTPVS